MATYSFLDVKVTLAGPGVNVSLGSNAGIAEEGITIEMEEDKDTLTVGAGGDAMHSLHAGTASNLTIRLLKTSPENAVLSDAYAFQTGSSSTHGQNTIRVTNIQQGDVASAQLVAFKKFPTVSYSKDGAMMEWTFSAGKTTIKLGPGVPDLSAA